MKSAFDLAKELACIPVIEIVDKKTKKKRVFIEDYEVSDPAVCKIVTKKDAENAEEAVKIALDYFLNQKESFEKFFEIETDVIETEEAAAKASFIILGPNIKLKNKEKEIDSKEILTEPINFCVVSALNPDSASIAVGLVDGVEVSTQAELVSTVKEFIEDMSRAIIFKKKLEIDENLSFGFQAIIEYDDSILYEKKKNNKKRKNL